MHRETDKLSELVNEMLQVVPQPFRYRRLVWMLMTTSLSKDPKARNNEVKKALAYMVRLFCSYLCEVAEDKDRTVELAKLLKEISPAILNGGNPGTVKDRVNALVQNNNGCVRI